MCREMLICPLPLKPLFSIRELCRNRKEDKAPDGDVEDKDLIPNFHKVSKLSHV